MGALDPESKIICTPAAIERKRDGNWRMRMEEDGWVSRLKGAREVTLNGFI